MCCSKRLFDMPIKTAHELELDVLELFAGRGVARLHLHVRDVQLLNRNLRHLVSAVTPRLSVLGP